MEINDVIQIIVEQNKQYKDMLTFAISSIITILVIFLTANFFTMRKLREEEKEKIKSDILLNIKNNDLEQLKINVKESIKEETHSEIAALRLSMSKAVREVKDLKLKNLELEASSYEMQGHIDSLEGVYENAFISYLEALDKTIFAGGSSTGHIPSILSSIETSAGKLNQIFVGELANFNKITSQLDSEYYLQVEKIKKILNEVKTF